MRRHLQDIRLKHINRSGHWPSGNPRLYYRPPGRKAVALPDLEANDPKFLQAYLDAEKGLSDKPAPLRTGSLAAAVVAYLASDTYLSLAASTRRVWRTGAEDIRRRYGKAVLREIETRHIRADLARLTGNPANHRLKIWRSMCRFWIDASLIDVDPAVTIRPRRIAATTGHEAWTREDVADFRAHWPHTTAQRLAFELLHRTCAAIVDACQIGPQHVKGDWLTFTRQKSGTMATCPWNGGPAWFEPDDHLRRCLDLAPRHLTFMTTAHGQPRSIKAASMWFARAAKAAGIAKTAHGIRKHRAAVFAENGASQDQRMAILGHETTSEAVHYSKSADLRRIISGTETSNFPNQLEKAHLNSLK